MPVPQFCVGRLRFIVLRELGFNPYFLRWHVIAEDYTPTIYFDLKDYTAVLGVEFNQRSRFSLGGQENEYPFTHDNRHL